jgi:hypothetical protein
MDTLSAAVGTPPDQVAGELQLPPGATHEMSARGAYGEEPEVRPRRRSRALGRVGPGVASGAWGGATRDATRADRAGPATFDCRAPGPTCADRTAGTAAETGRCELVLVPASATGTSPNPSAPTTNKQRRARPRDARGPLGAAPIEFTASPLPTPELSRSYNFRPGNSRFRALPARPGTSFNSCGEEASTRRGAARSARPRARRCWAASLGPPRRPPHRGSVLKPGRARASRPQPSC